MIRIVRESDTAIIGADPRFPRMLSAWGLVGNQLHELSISSRTRSLNLGDAGRGARDARLGGAPRAQTCSDAVGARRCINLGHLSASFVVSPDERFKLATMALFTNL